MHTRISLHTSLLFFPPLSVSHSTIAIGRGTDKRNVMCESYTTHRIKIIQFATTALHQLCATPPPMGMKNKKIRCQAWREECVSDSFHFF